MIGRLIKRLDNYKFVFRKNPEADILLLDDDNAKLRFEHHSAVNVNLREINLYYFIPQLLKSLVTKSGKEQFKKDYVKRLLGSFNSKIAIGHHITGYVFMYKECFPAKVAINYQYCRFLDYDLAKFYTFNKEKSLQCDYFFVYDERHAKRFSEVIKAHYIIAGSLKNNEIVLKPETRKYDIMYISEYRGSPVNEYYMVCHEFVIKVISDYCKLANKTFCIALSSRRSDKGNRISLEDELNYYNQFADFVIDAEKNSYEIAAASNLSVVIYSNLGTELLARKMKVLFLPIYGLLREEFNAEFLDGIEGPFWYKGVDKEVLKNKITSLLNMSNDEWQDTLSASGVAVKFDQGNNILKKLIENILIAGQDNAAGHDEKYRSLQFANGIN